VDLKSGYPYWAVKNGLMYAFPQLDADLSCDVAVVGAGITGALIADELAGHGHDVIVLEQRDACWGSTSASTALLQYEIDTHAIDLAKRYDQASALLAYQSCLRAISEIGAAAHGSAMSISPRVKACTTPVIALIIHAWPANLPGGISTAFRFAG